MRWEDVDPTLLAMVEDNPDAQPPDDWEIRIPDSEPSSSGYAASWYRRHAVTIFSSLVASLLLVIVLMQASRIRNDAASLRAVDLALQTKQIELAQDQRDRRTQDARISELTTETARLQDRIASFNPGSWPPRLLTLTGQTFSETSTGQKSLRPDAVVYMRFDRLVSGDYTGQITFSYPSDQDRFTVTYMVRATLDEVRRIPTLKIAFESVSISTGSTFDKIRTRNGIKLQVPDRFKLFGNVDDGGKREDVVLQLERSAQKFTVVDALIRFDGTYNTGPPN